MTKHRKENRMEVNSIEALVEAGTRDLQALADSGNTVASQWLERIQQQSVDMMKLVVFGEMRVTLQKVMGTNTEAKRVYEVMFPS